MAVTHEIATVLESFKVVNRENFPHPLKLPREQGNIAFISHTVPADGDQGSTVRLFSVPAGYEMRIVRSQFFIGAMGADAIADIGFSTHDEYDEANEPEEISAVADSFIDGQDIAAAVQVVLTGSLKSIDGVNIVLTQVGTGILDQGAVINGYIVYTLQPYQSAGRNVVEPEPEA